MLQEPEKKILKGFSIYPVQNARNNAYKEHKHPYFEILFIIKGRRRVRLNSGEFLAKDGDIIVFYPGEVHEEKTLTETISFIALTFWDYDLAQLKIDFPKLPPAFHIFNIPEQGQLLDVLNKIMLEKQGNLEDAEMLQSAYFIEFVVLLRRAFTKVLKGSANKQLSGKERIASAINLMENSLQKPVNLKELAGQSFLSASYFSQAFKEKTGKSPKQYLIKEKIAKAKKLLLETGKPLKQIALELGYETESYFFRQFKQKTGVTPMDFRDSGKVK